ncbi:MAG: TPM domain-containing protein [Deltaproteobacteria bacterium]|nr:TPM domain-containing protein [Deltaproteobacteria bacterium]
MRWISRRRLLQLVDEDLVRRAIAQAELRTSGEIRVSVSTFFWGSVERTARQAFERLGMTATRERNGVLLFVVPSRRRFAVLGDVGIHQKVGDELWRKVSAEVSGHFREGDFTGGLVRAIELVGEELGRHFPRGPEDVNELSDELDFGKHPPEP